MDIAGSVVDKDTPAAKHVVLTRLAPTAKQASFGRANEVVHRHSLAWRYAFSVAHNTAALAGSCSMFLFPKLAGGALRHLSQFASCSV
jgi:hypothetical protein